MEIIIDIDKEHYERIMCLEEGVTIYPTTLALYEAVKNGIQILNDNEDKKSSKEVVFSTLEKGQRFYFKNFQDKKDECEVCYKIPNRIGIEVYYKYIDTPNRIFSRYGDDIIVVVKESDICE